MRKHSFQSQSSNRASFSGQALIELALALPFLVLLLVGVFEFGMLLYAHVQVSNAAREGAMAAAHYRATRFTRVARDVNDQPISCDGVSGWSLNRTVRQAIVYRDVDEQGCPQDSGDIIYSSLGSLDVDPDPTWTVDVVGTLDTAGMPTVTAPGSVQLTYPYRLVIVSNLFPYFSGPISISKAVAFEYLQ